MENPQVLIFPDIHGRKFWKEAIMQFPKEQYPDLKIIFLGDYLDPYVDYDGISKEEAFVNFEEILEYINNDSRIIPLIGNHDWHYFVNLDNCRIDKARERDIEAMFKDNISKFRLTHEIELDGCKYLFSHAGVTQKWLEDVVNMSKYEVEHWNPGDRDNYVDPKTDEKYIWIEKLSHICETNDFSLFEESLQKYGDSFYTCPISMISRDRGGYYPHGSLIWADVHEHLFIDLQGYYQIFGHTYSYPNGNTKDYAISPCGHSWAMLDCGKAFVMDIEGNIEEMGNS